MRSTITNVFHIQDATIALKTPPFVLQTNIAAQLLMELLIIAQMLSVNLSQSLAIYQVWLVPQMPQENQKEFVVSQP